jgi:hypothetical protein
MPEPVRKVRVTTVLVTATTEPPQPGFRVRGRAVGFGEEVRLTIDEAADLEKRNKCRILEGSEKSELL